MPAAIRDARGVLEELHSWDSDADYTVLPRPGWASTIAWVLPYFRHFVSSRARRSIPVDRARIGRTVAGGSASPRGRPPGFRADPKDNDHWNRTTLRCSSAATTWTPLTTPNGVFSTTCRDSSTVTSIRSGFVGGGSQGQGPVCPSETGDACRNPPGAELMPNYGGVVLRFHLDGQARARAAEGSPTSRNTPATPSSLGRILRRRYPHAPVAPLRGHQRLVPQLRPR